MIASFDIFQTETDGSVLWLGSATTMDEAVARIQQVAARQARDYIVLNHQTGNQVVIPAGTNGAVGAKELHLPTWKMICLDALSESDAQKLPEKVAAAEAAIAQRLQELKDTPEENSEKMALRDASRAMAAVKSGEGQAPEWKAKTAD